MTELIRDFSIEYSVKDIGRDMVIIDHDLIDIEGKNKEEVIVKLKIVIDRALKLAGSIVTIHHVTEITNE